MRAKTGPNQAGCAGEGPKATAAELIPLLKSPERAVRARAAAALRRLEPPPTWELIAALAGAGDTDFQVEIMKLIRRPGRRARPASR